MQRIQCQKCGWWCDATLDAEPNDPNILSCRCCTRWHGHDEACRPVTVTLLDRTVITPDRDPAPW